MLGIIIRVFMGQSAVLDTTVNNTWFVNFYVKTVDEFYIK